jgi:hypothetical protein
LFADIEVFDNQQRRHSALGSMSPARFELRSAEQAAASQATCLLNRGKLTWPPGPGPCAHRRHARREPRGRRRHLVYRFGDEARQD